MKDYNAVVGLLDGYEYGVSFEDRQKNTMCIGPTGCGKYSQLIKPMLNQDLKRKDISVIVIDPKSLVGRDAYVLAKYYGREVYAIDPFIDDSSVLFNPLVESVLDCKKFLMDALESEAPLIPHYYDFYDDIIEKALIIVKYIYGKDANLLDLYYIISNEESKGVERLSSCYDLFLKGENNSYCDGSVDIGFEMMLEIHQWFMCNYYANEKEFLKSISLRSSLKKLIFNDYAKKMLILDRGQRDVLDLKEVIKRNAVLVVNTSSGYLRESFSFFSNMIFSYIETILSSESLLSGDNPISLYIDEPQSILIDRIVSVLDISENLSTTLCMQSRDVFKTQEFNNRKRIAGEPSPPKSGYAETWMGLPVS